jgi:hypothetical protein
VTPVQIAVEVAGWAGAVLILVAYWLLSIDKLAARSAAYQLMNLAGAVGFVINGWWHRAIPNAAMNIVWAGIAIYSLTRLARLRGPASASRE